MEAVKVVLITGSSRGIGRQLALDCARNGLAVAVSYVANVSASAPKPPPWSPPSCSGSAASTA